MLCFVHSFPRRLRKNIYNPIIKRQIESYLETFLQIGPLFTPEIINISSLIDGGNKRQGFPILQKRFCISLQFLR